MNMSVEALETACLISVGKQAFAVFYKGDFQIVVGLNESAHAFARLVKSGISAKEISKAYASELGIPEEVARDFIELIFEDWQRMKAIGPIFF